MRKERIVNRRNPKNTYNKTDAKTARAIRKTSSSNITRQKKEKYVVAFENNEFFFESGTAKQDDRSTIDSNLHHRFENVELPETQFRTPKDGDSIYNIPRYFRTTF